MFVSLAKHFISSNSHDYLCILWCILVLVFSYLLQGDSTVSHTVLHKICLFWFAINKKKLSNKIVVIKNISIKKKTEDILYIIANWGRGLSHRVFLLLYKWVIVWIQKLHFLHKTTINAFNRSRGRKITTFFRIPKITI